MDWTFIILIIVALLLIGFFSGIGIVFISANKLSIELRRKQGNYSGKTWSFFLESPARFIVTTLLITNILLVIYGLLASDALAGVWKYWLIENQFVILAI
jgi:CBS domain containing-hemolysin-like protein